MRELTKKDIKLIKSICGLSQKGLRKTLLSYIRTKYDKVYHSKDYILAVGDIPVALAAHMDTVFDTPARNIYYDKESGVMWSPEGLGADDRAGIFIILKLINNGLRPTIIFTADEEIGALGAEALIKKFPNKPPCPINFIIQLDRRGTNDCVFYDCDNVNFVNYIEGFGFCENVGSFSDISVICPEWGVAGVNLSVGYEDEHSYIETLHIAPLSQTLEKVTEILKQKVIPSFEYVPSVSYWKHGSKWWNFPEEDDTEEKYVCSGCGKTLTAFNLIPCYGESQDITKFYCPDCCTKNVSWCNECGEAYETKDENSVICPSCKRKIINRGKFKYEF